ncbi:MAG: hypothetical protein AB8H80_19100 [Planctomycetota bacterium]
MRSIALLAVASLTTLAVAQSPLVIGNTPNNQGNPGGGLYFNLTVLNTLTIDEINFGIGGNTAAGAACSVNIWLGPSTYIGNVTNPSLWVQVGTTVPYTKVAAAPGYEVSVGSTVQPAGGNTGPLTLAPGTYAIALEAVGCSHGYTNGLGCAGSAPPGSCTNAVWTNGDLELRGGQAQNNFLGGGVFSPRIFAGEISYTLGGNPINFASREAYGEGCYSNYQSWYEYWPNPASIDYANTSLLMTYNSANNTYDVTTGTTPVDLASLVNPALGHPADGEILISATSAVPETLLSQPILYAGPNGTEVALDVNMNADGFLTLGGTSPGLWAAASIVDDLFALSSPLPTNPTQVPAIVGNFKFMDPTTGTTHFDFNGTENLFTWQNVDANTFQIAINASGDIEIRWDAMAVAGGGGNPAVVGYVTGGGAFDPGSIDFSVEAPFSTQGNDSNPLVLGATVNPVLGNTVDLTVSDQTPNPGLGITFVTTVQLPGVDLGIIGAPGCLAHVDINAGAGFAIDSIPLNGLTVNFAIPNNPAISGLSFFCQSAWLDAAANAFGVKTSNGLRLQTGNF